MRPYKRSTLFERFVRHKQHLAVVKDVSQLGEAAGGVHDLRSAQLQLAWGSCVVRRRTPAYTCKQSSFNAAKSVP